MSPLLAFRRLSLPHLASHKLRTAITILGIALGVAAMTGLRLAYEPITRACEQMVANLSGRAVLQISNGDLGVAEELLEEVRQVAGVRTASASVQGFMPLLGHPGERLYVLGIDLLADRDVRDYDFSASAGPNDETAFLSQPDSVALSRPFLELVGAKIGDRIGVRAPGGPVELTVRASLDARSGPASLFGGRLAIMDLFAAQRLFHLDGRFRQIDVTLQAGAGIDDVQARLADVVRGRAAVEAQRANTDSLARLVAFQRHLSTLHAFGAVVVGLSVIFNTMMISVVQRRREIGCLRSVGLRRRHVIRLLLVEAGMLSLVGSALGVPLGVGLARMMSVPLLKRLGSTLLPINVPPVDIHAGPILLGVLLGVSTSLLAALVPAREAARISPLEALRTPAISGEHARPYGVAALVGLAAAAITSAIWAHGGLLDPYVATFGASLGFLAGIVLSVPLLVRALTTLLRPFLARLFGVPGVIASCALAGSTGRSAITSSFFVVCLAYVVGASATYSTLQHTFSRWFDSTFKDVDLVISAGAPPLSDGSTPLPAALADELAKVHGVAAVGASRLSKLQFRGVPALLMAIDPASIRRRLRLVEGDPTETAAALARGDGVVVDEAFVTDFGLRPGEPVVLATPSGEVRLRVLAVSFSVRGSDMSRDPATITMDLHHYQRLWSDDTVNLLDVAVQNRGEIEAVAGAIRAGWGERYGLFVTHIREFRDDLEEQVQRDLSAIPPILAIAVVIALLGVANNLLASVLDRLREIGIMRAIGTTRRQMARAVMLEGAFTGLLGGILAAVFGSCIGFQEIRILGKSLTGTTLVYNQPLSTIEATLVLAVVCSAAAGYFPGRSAARLKVTDVLSRE